jgi:tetratricopeptide (TPR) repeat protein
MVRATKRGRWHAVGWLTKGTVAAALCVCFQGRTTSVAQETSWQNHLVDGQTLREQERYTEAEKVCSAVLAEAEKFGPEDRRVALTLNKLAGLYHATGRLSQAEPFYRRALAIWEKLSERMELASTLNNLARLCLDREAYDEVVTCPTAL